MSKNKKGIFADMPDYEYFLQPAINVSGLKTIVNKTPAHFLAEKSQPHIETKALTLGTAIHAATLQPDLFLSEYAKAPQVDKRTKEGKQIWAELEASNLKFLSADDYELVENVSLAVRNHVSASKLLQLGAAEVAVFSEFDGTPVKCKCDYLRDSIAIIDLKTTENASPSGFMNSVEKYGYHQQAAWYLDIMSSLGQPVGNFIFIVVEKTAPFCVGIYELDDDWLAIGRSKNQKALDIYRKCMETGDWHGYSEDLELLSPPKWLINQQNSMSEY
jgi:hypothetical protein